METEVQTENEAGMVIVRVPLDWHDAYMDERAAIAALRQALRAADVPNIPSVVLKGAPALFGGSEAFLELERVLIKSGGMWSVPEDADEFLVVIDRV